MQKNSQKCGGFVTYTLPSLCRCMIKLALLHRHKVFRRQFDWWWHCSLHSCRVASMPILWGREHIASLASSSTLFPFHATPSCYYPLRMNLKQGNGYSLCNEQIEYSMNGTVNRSQPAFHNRWIQLWHVCVYATLCFRFNTQINQLNYHEMSIVITGYLM